MSLGRRLDSVASGMRRHHKTLGHHRIRRAILIGGGVSERALPLFSPPQWDPGQTCHTCGPGSIFFCSYVVDSRAHPRRRMLALRRAKARRVARRGGELKRSEALEPRGMAPPASGGWRAAKLMCRSADIALWAEADAAERSGPGGSESAGRAHGGEVLPSWPRRNRRALFFQSMQEAGVPMARSDEDWIAECRRARASSAKSIVPDGAGGRCKRSDRPPACETAWVRQGRRMCRHRSARAAEWISDRQPNRRRPTARP